MRLLSIIAAGLFLAACAGRDTQSEVPESGTHRLPRSERSKAHREALSAPALRSTELTVVPGGTFGPYIGRSPAGNVLVWATHDRKGRSQWASLGVSGSSPKQARPLLLGPAPEQLSLVVVKATGTSAAPGFITVAGEPGDRSAVHALLLGPGGELQGTPISLADTSGPLLWLDAVATSGAPLVFWAVSVAGSAEIYAARVDDARTIHKVAADALAWQLVPFGDGAALATVRQNGVRRDITLRFTDAAGKPSERPLVLRERSLAQLDLDMANVNGHLVVAWSEQPHLEPTLFAAAVDPSGQVSQAAKRLTAPMGEQSLVRLVPPAPDGKHGYVLWENVNQTRGERRLLQVAPLLPNATLGSARATVAMYGEASTLPEFSATPSGLAVLSQAPMCLKPPEPCDESDLLPVYVEFDERLNVVASEPLRLRDTHGAAIELAWGLGCDATGCTSLAAPKSGPAPIYWVDLEHTTDIFAPAARHRDDSVRPRLAANEALQEVEPLADLVAKKSGDAELVSWVTYFDPTLPYEKPKVAAPDGRFAPIRALLQTLNTKELDNEPSTISLRARSLGGVAMAEGAGSDFLLGWTAIDGQTPQVFLTLVSATGAKKQLQMLTRTPGEVSDVALARLADGWAVGWVDERNQDPEVYAVKIANNLLAAAPEQRLTESPGDAVDLAMVTLGDTVLLAWGDTQNGKQQGFANVFTRVLSAKDMAPMGPATQIERSGGHAQSIQLGRLKQTAVVAWIARGATGTPPRVMLAVLDGQGRPRGEPQALELPASSLQSLALDCTEQACHLLAAGTHDGLATLWGASFNGTTITHRELTTLTGSPTQQVTPTIDGDNVFLTEQSNEGQTRLRRLHIQWE